MNTPPATSQQLCNQLRPVILATQQTHLSNTLKRTINTSLLAIVTEADLQKYIITKQASLLLLDTRLNQHFDATLSHYYTQTLDIPVIHLVHSLHEARLLYLLGISSEHVAFIHGPIAKIKAMIHNYR